MSSLLRSGVASSVATAVAAATTGGACWAMLSSTGSGSSGLSSQVARPLAQASPVHKGVGFGRVGHRTYTVACGAALFMGSARLLGRRRRQGGGAGCGGRGGRSRRFAASTTVAVDSVEAEAEVELASRTPIIILSGFLGTGKTTLLKHWLENADSRIGVVVNDVAAVNIDAKLVKNQQMGVESQVDTIQLQNGCACCSLGDELLVTINDLLALQSDGGEPFSHIVVELSGVAEPQRVRDNFSQAEQYDSPVSEGMELSKVVTLIDASTFCTDYMEYNRLIDRPELLEEDSGMEGADLKVVELLVEQIEAADVVVLNKTDLAEQDTLEATRAVVGALNKVATICETSFGKVSLSALLAEPNKATNHDEHGHAEHSHSEHGHAEHGHEEHGKAANHDEHGHAEHGHSEHGRPENRHEEHGHEEHRHEEHGHQAHGPEEHGHANDCSAPSCSDPSHSHEEHGGGHEHSHSDAHTHDGAECHDASCTDPTHDHTHSNSSTTAEERFGIRSFTYTSRRPFNGDQLAQALQKWPVPKKECLSELLNMDSNGEILADAASPLSRVIRSKGFCWMDTYPSSRMYWSHAGKNMSLGYEGVWLDAMSEPQRKLMGTLIEEEYERSRREEWTEDWGDRRQELVFIGMNMDEDGIRKLLDECLLDESEMEAYRIKQEEDKIQLSEEWMRTEATLYREYEEDEYQD